MADKERKIRNDLSKFEGVDLNKISRAELEKLNRSAAKRANTRLRAIEKYATKTSKELGANFDALSFGAYKFAQRKLAGFDKVRFFEGHVGKSNRELRKNIQTALAFMRNDLSTIGGIKRNVGNQYKNFLEKVKEAQSIDAEIEIPSMSDFWHARERAWDSNLKRMFDSDVIMAAYTQGKLDVLEEVADELIHQVQETGTNPFITTERTNRYGGKVSDYMASDKLRTKAAIAETTDKRVKQFTRKR